MFSLRFFNILELDLELNKQNLTVYKADLWQLSFKSKIIEFVLLVLNESATEK